MDFAFNILLMFHLAALVAGGATNIAMPLLGRQMAGASPEVLARLGPIGRQLSLNSRIAVGVLVLTGIAMLWMRYGGDASGLGPWFIVKMAFVVLILIAVVAGALLTPGTIRPQIFGLVTRGALIAIVFCSVMTFG